ncbi:MAG: hypothetical protein P8X55_15750, partial [Desulfosarcinaceae bacterium]
KSSIPKCRECSINFKLSEGGWFPEAINFDESLIAKLLNKGCAQYRQSPSIQRWMKAIPFIEKSARKLKWFYV